MSQATPPSPPERASSIEDRLAKLAADKASLQLVIQMMNRLSAVPGLENTIESMLRAVADVIGGVNVVLWYRIDDEIHCVDVCGVERRLASIDDELVREAFEKREPIEREHPFRDTRMLTPEFTSAYTWAVPLMVGREVIGVLQMESLHLAMRDLSPQLPTFFGYAALVLKNEIEGYSRLQKEKRIVAALRQSERRLAEAERVAHIGYWDRDLDSGRIEMSDESYRIFGLPPEERYNDLAAWQARWLSLIHPDEREKVFQSYLVARGGGPRYDTNYRIVCPNGEVRFIRSIAETTRDDAGRARRVFGVMQDVTEQRRAEEALRRLNRELRAISNCNQTLMRAQDEQSLLDEVCRIVCEDAGYRLAWVGFAEHDEARTVRPVAHAGIDDGYLAESRISWADDAFGQGPAGTVIRTGKTVHVQDFGTLPGFDPWRERALARGYRSGIALPLKDESGSVFGAFLMYSGEANTLTPDEIRLQEELAGDLAFGITVLRARAERKKAAEKIAYLAAIVESTDDAVIGKSLDERILSWNRGAERIYGYTAEEALGRSISMLVPPDLEAELAGIMGRVRGGRRVEHLETVRARKDGARIHVALTISPIEDGSGRITGASVIARDITDQRRAVAQLRASEERFRELAATIEEVFWITDPRTSRMLYISPGYERIWGRSAASLLADPSSWMKAVDPGDRDRVTRAHAQLAATGVFDEEYRVVRPDGEVRWIRAQAFPVRNTDGEVERVAGVARDVTDRRAAQEEMRATNARYARQEAALMAVTRACALHHAGTAELMGEVTRVAAETLGVARASIWRFARDQQALVCRSLFEGSKAAHTDGMVLRTEDYPAYFRALAAGDVIAASDACSDPRTHEFAEGYLRPLGIASMLDAPILVMGSVAGVFCSEHVGPSRQWTADEQTFAIAIANLISLLLADEERQVIEGQLRQSQKMEAIGQLAGGVAHDFNNILTAIIMQVELTGMVDDLPEEVREGLRDVDAAAQRAANLTRQLLLFSRRQVMQPKNLDLNEVVTNLAKMLLRIIGEDIRLQLHLHAAPLMTRADAGMLDQVLMNLSVNARDAMSGGGRLLIETSETTVGDDVALQHPEVAPGRYVCLRVSDTGAGIPPEVLPHIFEPFFTTKEPGKGTGLGLATVFGIVKQHRGFTRVRSEPGCGATFEVVLPALELPRSEHADSAGRAGVRGGTETILLVEDEAAVRVLTRTILERRGYRVLEAATGAEALPIWRDHRAEVALLVTDLVMPGGVSGQQLAQQLQAEKPSLAVVFMSGYSAEVAGKEIQLRGGENFLQKPFAPNVLLETIRRCLDV